MRIDTPRLIVTELDASMAEAVHRNSVDADNRRYLPDEVFETAEDARAAIAWLTGCCEKREGPQVFAVTLRDGTVIGQVEAAPITGGWEIGYHLASAYTGRGYATEAVRAFLPAIMARLRISEISGVCLKENTASAGVLTRCGFALVGEGPAKYQGRDAVTGTYVFPGS